MNFYKFRMVMTRNRGKNSADLKKCVSIVAKTFLPSPPDIFYRFLQSIVCNFFQFLSIAFDNFIFLQAETNHKYTRTE